MKDDIRMPIVRELFPEGRKVVWKGWGNKNLPFYVSDTNDMFVLYGDTFLQVAYVYTDDNRTPLFVKDKASVFIADDVKVYCEFGFEAEYER